jgi:iron complex outermembrane recepter protein
MRWLLVWVLLVSGWPASLWAQPAQVLRGQVQDAQSGQPVPYASVYRSGSATGTTADAAGLFRLKTDRLPATLVVSSVGYRTVEVVVQGTQALVVELTPQPVLADEVVVTASRVAENSLRSGVTIEQLDRRALRQTPAATYFDALENLKGIQMTTVSLGFKVPNARGFTNPTNVRFLQLVDGVDNQAPVIGASIAAAVGPTELDLDRVEVVPGPASALYGMNSLNGLVHFFTRNPFDEPGLTVYQRTGLNHLNDPEVGPRLLSETAVRYAWSYRGRLALKINASHLTGYDWVAHQRMDLNPLANVSTGLSGEFNPALDPVSSYGNEAPNRRTLTLNDKNYVVARTGYYEKDITDYRLQNLKADLALHYRLAGGWETSYSYRIGRLDNVYQRTNRFRLDNYLLQQHVLQIKSPAFSGRAYLTHEDSGDSYNLRSLAENLDRHFKPDNRWFSDYRTRFLSSTAAGTSVEASHALARTYADEGRYRPGTARFDSVARELIGINNWDEGAALRTRAGLLHAEGQYDFSSRLKVVQLQAGFDLRMYRVFPDGNYFINPEREGRHLLYRKAGAFVQASRQWFGDRLRLNASLRYDKNDYFSGRFSTRASGGYRFQEHHHLRLSYQNGYRFPSLFEAFSNVNSGGVKRVGGLPVMSRGLFEDSYIRSSLDAFQSAVNQVVNQQGLPLPEAIGRQAGLIRQSGYGYIRPERVNAVEIGYKSLTLHNRLFLDADLYLTRYRDFIAQVEVNQLRRRDVPADSIPYFLYDRQQQARYRLWTNSSSAVYTYGASVGGRYTVWRGYTLGGTLSYAQLYRVPFNDGLEEAFNTPPWLLNLSLGNPAVGRQLGFQVVGHWQQAFRWESSLGSGTVGAFATLDAQLSLAVPAAPLRVKLSGTNVLNRRYYQLIAGPTLGAMYNLSLTFGEASR